MEESHSTSGQKFYLKEGRVFGNASAFTVGASKAINTETGELTERAAQLRIQMKVRGTTEFNTLSSVTLDQLQVATGKVWTPADIRLLTGATVLYYVSNRVEGQDFYYRPDSIKPAKAPRTDEFTSLFGIEVAPALQEEFESMPNVNRVITAEGTVTEPEQPTLAATIKKLDTVADLKAFAAEHTEFATILEQVTAATKVADIRKLMLATL